MANEFTVKVSDDQGLNWTTVKDDIEGYFPVGIQDLTGRIWIFYYREEKIYYVVSDVQGTTWQEEAEVVLQQGDPPEEVVPAEGKIGIDMDESGRLWISFWDSEDNEKAAYLDVEGGTWVVRDIT